MPLLKESEQVPPLTFTTTKHHCKSLEELLIPLTLVAKVTQNSPTLFELAEEILKVKQLQTAIPKSQRSSTTHFPDSLLITMPSAKNSLTKRNTNALAEM
jgi:hypothetical protein